MNELSSYQPATDRYVGRNEGWFRRAGASGLLLPAVSLGMWHNFGAPGTGRHADEGAMHTAARSIVFAAFDRGVTHFDLANNYGPPPGSAEERFGRILHEDLPAYRDQLIISTKAGNAMWDGPYGSLNSRKHLLASLDQSLRRLKVDYVDIYYSHRPDRNTPLEETLGALDTAVRQGKALYAGISGYPGGRTRAVLDVCERGSLVRPVLHQPRYSMFDRWIERDESGGSVLDVCGDRGVGMIVFSPLAQGLLTEKYLDGIPADSRAANQHGYLQREGVTAEIVEQARQLQVVARDCGKSLPQLALAWALRDDRVTSALIGASRPEQVIDCCQCLDNGGLDQGTIGVIEKILASGL